MKWNIGERVRKYEMEPYPEKIPEDDELCTVINRDGCVGTATWSVFKDGFVDIHFGGYKPDTTVLFFGNKFPPPY